MFWSTWPLNRCWVEGLGWAAETCSCSVDLSIQTEPSIIRVWRLCPWTPAYFICQQSLPARCVHVKTSPGFKEVNCIFISCLVTPSCKIYFFSQAHAPPFSLSHSQSWELVLNPSFLLFQNRRGIWKRFFAIIFNHMRPSQSRPALVITFAWVSGFALQVSVVPM